jgi:predicted RecB family nuclease
MLVTNDILYSFINCQYKAYLKGKQQLGSTSEYQILYTKLKQIQTDNFEKQFSTIREGFSKNISFDNLFNKEANALNVKFVNENIDISLDGIEFSGKKFFTPIFITPFEKVTRVDKLFLALQCTLIQTNFNIQAPLCKIIFGQNLKETKFKVSTFSKAIKKIGADLTKLLSNSNAPLFYKNQHCQICEFQNSCLEKLVERDDLSLLAGLKPKEILSKNNRGLFSVKQLSYKFHPKKNPHLKRKFLPELKALAIREGKTFIHQISNIVTSPNEIFLDIEGLPDRGFYYLIGVIIKASGSEKTYSFWANNENEEKNIFIEFITLLQSLNEFKIYHYGSYETQALKNISKKISPEHQDFLKKIIESSFNVLTIFTNDIYPPTYSNGLKEIARFLKFDWSEKDATGLQSVVWRYNWEISNNDEFKNKLIIYNIEDCRALDKIVTWLKNISNEDIANASEVKKQYYYYKIGKPNHLITDYEVINKYSYFDYQRNKIYLKTSKTVKNAVHRKEVIQKSTNKIDKKIIYTTSQCPYCDCKKLRPIKPYHRIVVDLKFMRNGIKKWVVNNIFYNYICKECKKRVVSKYYVKDKSVYGKNIAVWSIYQHIQYNLSLDKTIKMLHDIFHVRVSQEVMHAFQSKFIQKYYSTYEEIKSMLIGGNLIHADETMGGLRDLSNGYVWAFSNMESALYMYKPNRQADFLLDFLKTFKGVLITDFYTGYDAIQCPQQKCLVHLMRDINEDLLRNQLNQEFMSFAAGLGHLLRNILETVNKYGLKKRNLSKHKKEVQNYFSKISITEFDTELTISYQKRLLKNKEKLFTFIEYDGISWNNNNAENAIKSFSYYRTVAKNKLNEKGMTNYLVMLSILQTCKYRGINFFEFLKSGETSIEKFSMK